MERWADKVAVVTGASAGIGAAIAMDLARAGVRTIGLARRSERIEALRDQLTPEAAARLHAYRCDVSREEDIVQAFAWIEQTFGGVDILVNNAGVVRPHIGLLTPGNTAQMRETLDLNVMGPVLCTREAFRSMKKRGNGGCGHVVLMNSISGHWVPYAVGSADGSLNIYEPSKFAVTAMTEVLRQEFLASGTRVKVTSISPGSVQTEMWPTALTEAGALLQTADISAAVMYVLGTPEHVQVHELVIKPLGEQYL